MFYVSESDDQATVDFTLTDYAQYTRYLDVLVANRTAHPLTRQDDTENHADGKTYHRMNYRDDDRGWVYVNGWGYR